MMRLALITLVAGLGACSTPPLKLELAISDLPDDSCGTNMCAGIQLKCDTVASIRILDPNTPSAPYISECKPIPADNKKDLCALAHLTLDPIPLPEQTLEIQVVVYPATAIPTDPMTNALICPTEKEGLTFDAATGFPSGPIHMQDPADPTHHYDIEPAIGGRAFYHKGDALTVVTMACNDLGSLNNAMCLGANSVSVTATVNDFTKNTSVSQGTGDQLTVRIGEPQADPNGTGEYVLSSVNARVLDRTVEGPTPAWGANIDLKFQQAACIEVLEDGPQTTATLACKSVPTATSSVDITGYRLASMAAAGASLDLILNALGNPPLDKGLVVGILYDENDVPLGHRKITVPSSVLPVEYINDNFTGTQPFTSGNGIFVSRDAPFGTMFSTPNNANATPGAITALGGLVKGKVTLVVLQLTKAPPVQ